MEDLPNDRVESLDEWLVLATFGLVAPAQERIRLEIEAHYSDAVAARLGEGMSREAAGAAALLELGDARTAAKAFRKRHLTEKEKEQIQKLDDSYRCRKSGGLMLLFTVPILMFLLLVLLLTGYESLLFALALGSAVPSWAAFFYGRYLRANLPIGTVRSAKLLRLQIVDDLSVTLFGSLFWILWFRNFARQSSHETLLITSTVVGSSLLSAIFRIPKPLRLWWKARQVQSYPDGRAGA